VLGPPLLAPFALRFQPLFFCSAPAEPIPSSRPLDNRAGARSDRQGWRAAAPQGVSLTAVSTTARSEARGKGGSTSPTIDCLARNPIKQRDSAHSSPATSTRNNSPELISTGSRPSRHTAAGQTAAFAKVQISDGLAPIAAQLQTYDVTRLAGLEAAFAQIVAGPAAGLLTFSDHRTFAYRNMIADFAAAHRLATIFSMPDKLHRLCLVIGIQ